MNVPKSLPDTKSTSSLASKPGYQNETTSPSDSFLRGSIVRSVDTYRGRARPYPHRLSSASKLEETHQLREAFLCMDCPVADDLARRINSCVAERKEEWRWRAGGTRLEWLVFQRCGRLACPFCHPVVVRRAMAKASSAFSTAGNEHASLVTIHLARTGDLNALRDIIGDARRKLRDCRDAAARKWERWGGLQMFGYVEVGAVSEPDIQFLPPERQEAVLSSPMISCMGADPNWLPHLHMLVRHEGIGRKELQAILTRRFPGSRRVHVQAFHLDKDAVENAEAIIRYTLKRSSLLILDGGREEPVAGGVEGTLLRVATQPEARHSAASGKDGAKEENTMSISLLMRTEALIFARPNRRD